MSEPAIQSKASLLEERRKKLAAWKKQREEKQKQSQQTSDTKKEIPKDKDSIALKRPPGQPQPIKNNSKTKRKKITFDQEDENENTQLDLSKLNEANDPEPFQLAPVGNLDSLDYFMGTLDAEQDHRSETESNLVIDIKPDQAFLDVESSDGEEDAFVPQSRRKRKNKRKIISRLDTSTLVPFEKNFYQEPLELQRLSDEEVSDLRLSLDNILVEGNGFIPKPITKWSYLGVSSDIMNVITKDMKFTNPTPIQAQAIPCIMSGRDVLGISKTGSGKTVSYLLPLLRQIQQQPPLRKGETGPIGLILSPTRELAFQIYEEVVKFTPSGVTSIVCTGGGELKEQISTIKRGVQIVVATPGRFIDLVTINSGNLMKTNRISMVILDESDRLFDMGFGPQVRNVMRGIRNDRQCVLFSATFPDSLQKFANLFLDDPISITINSKNVVNENIHQKCSVFSDERAKFEGFTKILDVVNNTSAKTAVFVSSQEHCDTLYEKLLDYNMDSDYEIFSIHAGKSSDERSQSLHSFKKTNRKSILICTEILSRGLNIPEIELVIIYDAIKAFPQYVHTTGRTARTADSVGVAHTLLLDHDCDLAASYVLFKSMRQTDLDGMEKVDLEVLTKMYKKFDAGLKKGIYKIVQGLGGRGLDNMDKLQQMEQQKRKLEFMKENGQDTDEEEEGDVLSEEDMKLDYTMEPVYDGAAVVTYRAMVMVNDLPQPVRWEVTKNDTLLEVKRESGTSTTTRGKYYAPGAKFDAGQDEPKLYLLLENKVEDDLKEAMRILQAAAVVGYKKHHSNESKKFAI